MVRLTVTTSTISLTLLLLVGPLTSEAQGPEKVPRIGVVGVGLSDETPWGYAFRDGLREFGYVVGQSIFVEWRETRDETRYADFAAELVRLKVDLIVAGNNPAIQATQKATRTIPIVMVQATDPVGLGFVASLARPGGNITGLTVQAPELAGKRLQFLKETIPSLSSVGILWDPAPGWGRHMFSGADAAARVLGIRLQLVEVRGPRELNSALSSLVRERADAVFYPGSIWQGVHRVRFAEDAVKHGLATMCSARIYAEAGCLMSYAASFTDLWRRAAYFVDRIGLAQGGPDH